MTEPLFLGEQAERKGSLLLRSNRVNYGRAVLISNWHQAREEEPKDYDVSKSEVRDIKRSTYKRIGYIKDWKVPLTTYQEHTDPSDLKRQSFMRKEHKDMVTLDTVKNTNIDRETGPAIDGFSPSLPRHPEDHFKMYTETTHQAHFKPPYPYTSRPYVPPTDIPLSPAYKTNISQFTDTTDYRRPGRNTWQDESGIYGNSHFKRELYVPSKPITDRLE